MIRLILMPEKNCVLQFFSGGFGGNVIPPCLSKCFAFRRDILSRISVLCAAVLCLSAGMAHAREQVFTSPSRLLTMDCVVAAAREHDLPLAALVGILAVEDGKTGEALRNTNGTWDVGRFQINTCHVNALAAMGITAETVLRDGCVNARAAAWLLRREYVRTGNIWAAIGAYHSRTPERRDAYIAKVRRHLARLGFKGLAALTAEEVGR